MKNPAQATAYMDAVIDLEDAVALLVSLRHVARPHEIAELTRSAELGDKSLFKVLNENGNPTVDTVNKALQVIGLHLSVPPAIHGIEHG